MAMILCPECGKQISDRASACPHCGNPMQPNATQPHVVPPPPPNKDEGPKVGFRETRVLVCPTCNTPLSTKDIISSSWAKCPSCKREISLVGNASEFDDDQLIEKIVKLRGTKDGYHKLFMQSVMDKGARQSFDNLKIISRKCKMFWIREFGQGEQRAFYPMCDYGKDVFSKLFGKPYVEQKESKTLFLQEDIFRFNNTDASQGEILPKKLSSAECKYEFSHTPVGNYAATSAYICVPVVEEVVSYEGQEYTFIGVNERSVWNNFPKEPFFDTTPKYTNMHLFTGIVLAILILIAILTVIDMFSDGFVNGVIYLVILGALGSIIGAIVVAVGAIVLVPFRGIDALIRSAINKRRQKKFYKKWRAIQEYKKEAALRNMGLELTYTIPTFPY